MDDGAGGQQTGCIGREAFMDTGVDGSAALGAGLAIVNIIGLIIGVFYLFCQWKIFVKAGHPGWAAIIPFYNLYIQNQITGRPTWWFLLYFVPAINVFVALLNLFELGRAFRKSDGFNIGLALLSFIFVPMLAFDDSRYHGPNPAF
jgi:hypothetical protein